MSFTSKTEHFSLTVCDFCQILSSHNFTKLMNNLKITSEQRTVKRKWIRKSEETNNCPMASSSNTSWQIDGETMETVTDFIFLGSKITADGNCSHEIKRCLLLGIKVMTNLDSLLKSRDITLLTKVYVVKAVVFPVSCMDVRAGP